jgi:hypothetical protein
VGVKVPFLKSLIIDVSYHKGAVSSEFAIEDGVTTRESVSVSVGYPGEKISMYLKGEYRTDGNTEGKIHNEQILTAAAIRLPLTRDLTLTGKFYHGRTDGMNPRERVSGFTEGLLGIALRPIRYDWFQMLFRYGRLMEYLKIPQEEGSPSDGNNDLQILDYNVSQLTVSFDLGPVVNLSGASGVKSVVEPKKNPDDEIDHSILSLMRIDFKINKRWVLISEYRRLWNWIDGDMKSEHSVVIELGRYIMKNIRLTAGYNFGGVAGDVFDRDLKESNLFFRVQGFI